MKQGVNGSHKSVSGKSKISETDILEKDAHEMEQRLKVLQERIKQQRIEDMSIPKPGGSRWSGARADKGNLMAYGKDLQQKYAKKREREGGGDPALWPSAANRSKNNSTKMRSSDIKSKEVSLWSCEDVSVWLSSITLPQYSSVFAVNQISGATLLDISLEDLDYMDIKTLAHRKLLLRCIEELRKNKRFVGIVTTIGNSSSSNDMSPLSTRERDSSDQKKDAKSPVSKDPRADTAITSKNISVEALMQQEKQRIKETHWSDVEPLSSKEVVGPSSHVGANAADGDDGDTFDEEKERQAFQEAVMQWRSENSAPSNKNIPPAIPSDTLWGNPFEDMSDQKLAPRRPSVKIVREYERTTNIPSILNTEDISGNRIRSNNASLLDGDFDEEKERFAFMQAVAQWRNSNPDNREDCMRSEKKEMYSKSFGPSTGAVGKVSGKSIAEKLAIQLEQEKEQAMKQLNDQIAAAKRLQESSTLSSRGQNFHENLKELQRKYVSSNDDEVVANTANQDKELKNYGDVNIDQDYGDSDLLQSDIEDDDDDAAEDMAFQSCTEIEIIESKLGYSNEADESEYIVEIDDN